MKILLPLIAIASLVGCSQQPASGAASGSGEPSLAQKLEKMSPQDREAYVKSHMDEVTKSGNTMPTRK